MSMIAGIGGIAGGLYNMFGGGGNSNASNVQLPGQQPFNLGGVTGNINQGIGGLGQYNVGGQNLGQYQDILQSNVGNPFSGPAMGAASMFGGAGMGNALSGLHNSQQMSGMIPGMIQGGNMLMQQGFDPRNDLYNRTQQQSQDQNLASLMRSGVGGTPWGQGVAANANNNFNIDWQNNQLSRMLQGAQGAGNMWSGAGNMAQGAFGLGNSAAGAGAQMGMLPYGTFNQITGNALQALQGGAGYGQSAAAVPQMANADWMQYMGLGNQANSINNQTAQLGLQQADLANRQQMGWGQSIGQGLSALGRGGYGVGGYQWS